MHALRRRPRFHVVVGLTALPLAIALAIGGCVPPPDGTGDPNQGVDANMPPIQTGNSGITGQYAGTSYCALCHAHVHADWGGTLHAKALETLEKINQAKNPDCLVCHTVGYGKAGGFKDRATTNDLANVACEACHGPGRDHVNNAADPAKRPPKSIAASVCGACHTDSHHPTYDDWQTSRHASIQPELVTEFAAGTNANTCGKCHSGDAFVMNVRGETVPANLLVGKTQAEMNPVTCAVCHDPHQKTGNAVTPEDGRDYQLRFAQIKYTTPTNTVAAVQDATRFNICGQCHHARERVWSDSSRGPHPSNQVNVFFGEMPLPASQPDPITLSRPSVHLNATAQCSTCHVTRKPAEEGISPVVTGHTFEVNFAGCVDCHGTAAIAEAKLNGLKVEIDEREARIVAALDAWATAANIESLGTASWRYTNDTPAGPSAAGQALIPDNVKKARYIYYYMIGGGGAGAHNPDFVRDGLIAAEQYALAASNP